jgi:hypothetical protein
MTACQNGEEETVELLLKKGGADANVQDQEGDTALVYACHNGELGCVKLLVEHKANLDLAAQNGWTALFYCCAEGEHSCAQFLVEHGADTRIKAGGKSGKTAVDIASENGFDSLVRLIHQPALQALQIRRDAKAAKVADAASNLAPGVGKPTTQGSSGSSRKLSGLSFAQRQQRGNAKQRGMKQHLLARAKQNRNKVSSIARAMQISRAPATSDEQSLMFSPTVGASKAAAPAAPSIEPAKGGSAKPSLTKAVGKVMIMSSVIRTMQRSSSVLDNAVKHVASNDPNVKEVDLWGEEIGDGGVVRLAKALEGNTHVTILKLQKNMIGDTGAIALAKTLEGAACIIQEVQLSHNLIGDEGVTAIAKALQAHSSSTLKTASTTGSLVHLWLGSNPQISEKGVNALIHSLESSPSILSVVPPMCSEKQNELIGGTPVSTPVPQASFCSHL